MEKVKVGIKGMNCGHCVKRVEEAASSIPGLDKVKVNLKKGEAKIKYDEAIANPELFIAAITEAGYEAALI